MISRSVRLACALSFAFACAAPLQAQSIWGVHGPSRGASNTAGPPGCTPCPIAGPLLSTFDYGLPSGGSCAVPAPFPGPTFGPFGFEWGDVTVNRVADTVWVTDGFLVTGYTKAAATIADFPNPLPFPLTGLGYQAPNTLWLTDGFHCMAVTPPAGCGGTATITTPSFPIVAPVFGFSTDVDYDPCSNLLHLSASNGLVATMTTAGAPGAVYAPGLSCPLLPFLSGLAIDTATPGTMFLTDGVTVVRATLNAGLLLYETAPTVDYAPCCSWPWAGSGGPTSGLAFDATPIAMCPGCDPFGAPPAVLEATHQAISPNPSFGLAISGAPAGAAGFLVVGPCLCPGLPLPCGCTLCVFPQFVLPLFGSGAGTVAFPAPLPGGLACLGLDVCVQAVFQVPGSPCLSTSNALNVSIAAP